MLHILIYLCKRILLVDYDHPVKRDFSEIVKKTTYSNIVDVIIYKIKICNDTCNISTRTPRKYDIQRSTCFSSQYLLLLVLAIDDKHNIRNYLRIVHISTNHSLHFLVTKT